MPLVSVVIPTYNGAAWIAETLRSVFAQTLGADAMEVIVVDDGSTDDTAERLAPFRERIRLIRQENRGVGAARNRGLDAACGTYVAPLDHDDLWHPRKLEVQVDFMEEHPSVVGCVVPWATSVRPGEPVFDRAALCDEEGMIPRPIRQHWMHCFWRSSFALMHHAAIEDLRYGTERGCTEDREFELRLFARGPVGVAGTAILGIYRVHGDNTSGDLDYSVQGTRRLRRLARTGYFDSLDDRQHQDLSTFLGQRSRSVLTSLLREGRRRDAAQLYLDEATDLWRSRNRLFAAAFPGLLLAPPALINHLWPSADPLQSSS